MTYMIDEAVRGAAGLAVGPALGTKEHEAGRQRGGPDRHAGTAGPPSARLSARTATRVGEPWRAPALQECRESDDSLVVRIPAHDAAAASAVAQLYTRYATTVYGVGLRVLHDAGGAEDLVQETFWRLWRVAERYEPGRVRFATWLIRLATNLALDEWRRVARRPRVAPAMSHPADDGAGSEGEGRSEPCDPDADVVAHVWQAALRRRLVAGLERLPREQRVAVRLAYFGGLSHAEIAAAQQTPLSTVKTRLALGLRKLARDLTDGSVSLQDAS
ncbi:MAG: RNA polymerase sigma factor [Chloroflexota bacterium]|nr:RNA polymerase sigma factor [Chloroflexota bacterium]